jgi:hypothetical protein
MLAEKGVRLFDQLQTGAVIIRIEAAETIVRGFCGGPEIRIGRPL